MKDRLWTKQYLLVIVTNFLLYVVYYQLMLWTTSYAMHIWKADVSEAGLAAGLFIISALVARLLAGHFIDGLGRGFVLRCGTALYAASMLLYFFITSMLEFEAIRVVHGFAYGLASTAASTIVATIIPLKRQGEGIGYFTLGVTIASAIGPFLGIWFTQHGMYEASVWICSAVGVLAFVLSLLIRTPAHRMTEAEKKEMRTLKFSTFFQLEALPISFIAMLGGVCYSTVLAYIGAYSQSLSLFWAGSVFFLGFAFTSIISRPVTGRLLDEFGGSVVVYPALIFLAAAMVLIGAARSNGMLLSGALVLGLGFATITSACHAPRSVCQPATICRPRNGNVLCTVLMSASALGLIRSDFLFRISVFRLVYFACGISCGCRYPNLLGSDRTYRHLLDIGDEKSTFSAAQSD